MSAFFISFTNYLNQKGTYSEQELVVLLREQNEPAFSYLYDNYSGALYGVVLQVVNDPETANDVLQEVFVNIWRKIGQYDPAKGRLYTWMLNIARNAAIDKIRSRAWQDNRQNRPLPENLETIGATTGPKTDDVGLKKVLGKLKEEHRTLVDLSYFQGFTHEEIARILELPLGTVKTRIRTALTQLRTLLQ